MKVSEVDVVMVPGLGNSGPDHWQTRWAKKLSTARRVEQADWESPQVDAWTEQLVDTVAQSERPVVLVGHSMGVATIVRAASRLAAHDVRGAFLVAYADVDHTEILACAPTFTPISRDPLPFPSVLIASRNDPWCAYETSDDLGHAWGSLIMDGGESGHFSVDDGFGPWPEGTFLFARFLSRLS